MGPLFWACRGWACACACACGGPVGAVMPSNLGSGPPAMRRAVNFPSFTSGLQITLTFQCKLSRGWPSCLRVSDQSQNNAESSGCEQSSVLIVRNLPDLHWFACVSTSLKLAWCSVCPPPLEHPAVVASFRRTLLPPLQSPPQSFRYPQRRIIGRTGVAPRGLGGGWDALDMKGSQLQLIWHKDPGPGGFTYAAPRVAGTPRQPCFLMMFSDPPRRAGVDVQRQQRSSGTAYRY